MLSYGNSCTEKTNQNKKPTKQQTTNPQSPPQTKTKQDPNQTKINKQICIYIHTHWWFQGYDHSSQMLAMAQGVPWGKSSG